MKKSPALARKTKILACGTFDLLHAGHEFFLREAKKLGDELVVLVALDANVQKIKNKNPQDNTETRRKKVANLPYVDKVKMGDAEDFAQVLREENPDILALGYDQKIPAQIPDFSQKFPQIKIVEISAHKPEKYKTSLLYKDEKS